MDIADQKPFIFVQNINKIVLPGDNDDFKEYRVETNYVNA